ncbi:MAG: DUF4410 domain-containing protein [Planctomycetes bacterium]|nr:DUF4410 domain-containing protein [Planctomycetota bacterium]
MPTPTPLRAALLTAALLATSCATSSQLVEDRLLDAAGVAAVELGTVRLDYAQWSKQDAKVLDKAKQQESAWTKALGDAFLARANKRGLGNGTDRVRVDITVVDLDPGSQAARYFVGFGAGTGRISAQVDVAGHGSFRMNAKITGGAWGGGFEGVLEELGASAANHLADARQRK